MYYCFQLILYIVVAELLIESIWLETPGAGQVERSNFTVNIIHKKQQQNNKSKNK